MDKNFEKELTVALEKQFKRNRDAALLTGSKAICGVVLNKAKDKTISNQEKLNDIIGFCERCLDITEKSKEN